MIRLQPLTIPDAMTGNQKLHAAALQFLGVREISGPRSHTLIKEWIKSAASWLDPDDSKTAWCGCFRGMLGIVTGTGAPLAHYRAMNWLAWGKPIDSKRPELWQQGDTLILKRKGGAHVALVHEVQANKRRVQCLGGNQSDAVSIAPFPLADVLGVRRAIEIPADAKPSTKKAKP